MWFVVTKISGYNLFSKISDDIISYGLWFGQRWSRGHKARGQGQVHKKIRGQGQGQPFQGQKLSRPRTGMLEAKAKNQGQRRKCSQKKKVFKIFFQALSNSLAYPEFLIGVSPALKL